MVSKRILDCLFYNTVIEVGSCSETDILFYLKYIKTSTDYVIGLEDGEVNPKYTDTEKGRFIYFYFMKTHVLQRDTHCQFDSQFYGDRNLCLSIKDFCRILSALLEGKLEKVIEILSEDG